MARVNISVPDELLRRAKADGLNISQLARWAIADELERRAKIAAVDAYLAEQDAEFGPLGQGELAAARQWVGSAFGSADGCAASGRSPN